MTAVPASLPHAALDAGATAPSGPPGLSRALFEERLRALYAAAAAGDFSGGAEVRELVFAYETLLPPDQRVALTRRPFDMPELGHHPGQAAPDPESAPLVWRERFARTDDVTFWNLILAGHKIDLPPLRHTRPPPAAEAARARRNVAILGLLIGFIGLIFLITLAHLGRYALARPF